MAVRLRLTRMGRKKKPFYRVVAVDNRKRRDGAYLENLGHYSPLSDPIELKLNEERILYWLKVGAQPSETVRSLLRREGILFKWDLIKKGFDEARIQEELKKLEVIQLERKRKREQAQEKKAVEAEPEAEAESASEEKAVEEKAEEAVEEKAEAAAETVAEESEAAPKEEEASEEAETKEA